MRHVVVVAPYFGGTMLRFLVDMAELDVKLGVTEAVGVGLPVGWGAGGAAALQVV